MFQLKTNAGLFVFFLSCVKITSISSYYQFTIVQSQRWHLYYVRCAGRDQKILTVRRSWNDI